jgi:hypothetical protein
MRRLFPPATLLAVLCTAAAASAGTVGGQLAIDTEITGGPEEGAVIEDESPSPHELETLEFDEEECEEVGEELEGEEGDLEVCEEGGTTSALPPEECLLRSARARVLTYTAHDKVRLVIRYTSFAPADVLVGYRLAGSGGSLGLGSARAHFAKGGIYRATERLSETQAAKVRAAKRFTVTLDILGAPAYCHRFETRHLTIRKTVHNQVVWFQEGSIFGTKP